MRKALNIGNMFACFQINITRFPYSIVVTLDLKRICT